MNFYDTDISDTTTYALNKTVILDRRVDGNAVSITMILKKKKSSFFGSDGNSLRFKQDSLPVIVFYLTIILHTFPDQ